MKPEWKEFFDNPNQAFSDPEDQELATLFNEVSELETPDPGSNYWNSFNERLQENLSQTSPRKSLIQHLGSLFIQPNWIKSVVWALMICGIGFVSFYFINKTDGHVSINNFDSLANLTQDDLQLLEDLMPLDDTLTYADTQNFWSDETVMDLYQDSDTLYIDLDSMDISILENLIEEEG